MTLSASPAARCAAHLDVGALGRCSSCGRALCEACATHGGVDGLFCSPCVAVIRRASPWVRPLFTAGFLVAMALPILAWASPAYRTIVGVGYVVAAVAAVGHSYAKARKLRAAFAPVRREPTSGRSAPARPVVTYRSLPRRMAAPMRVLTPPLSTSWATLVVGAALALPALVVPKLTGFPRWLAAESVLAVWWGMTALALAHVLFHGIAIADDDGRLEDVSLADRNERGSWSPLDLDLTFDPDWGCVGAVLVLVTAMALLVGLGFFLAELAVPAIFTAGYAALGTAYRAATRDRHDCRGHLARALFWGAIWATIYTAPLALTVAVVHFSAP